MHIREVFSQERPVVRCLPNGKLRVGQCTYSGSVLLIHGQIRAWEPGSVFAIDPASLRSVREARPPVDLLLIGTGAVRERICDDVVSALDEAGVAHEAMATSSAVRALNALAGDVREIALAALPG